MAHVNHRDHDFEFRQDGLLRFTVNDCEDCSQCFVTFDDLVNASSQRFDVECALKPEDDRNVICRSVGVQTIENPQSLLCVGEWKDLITIDRCDRRCCGRVTAVLAQQVDDFRFVRGELCEQARAESFRRRTVTQTLAFDPQLYVEVAQVREQFYGPHNSPISRSPSAPAATAWTSNVLQRRASILSAWPAMVGSSNTARSGISTLSRLRICETSCVASNE